MKVVLIVHIGNQFDCLDSHSSLASICPKYGMIEPHSAHSGAPAETAAKGSCSYRSGSVGRSVGTALVLKLPLQVMIDPPFHISFFEFGLGMQIADIHIEYGIVQQGNLLNRPRTCRPYFR